MRHLLLAPALLLAACGHGIDADNAAANENEIRNAQRTESSASPAAAAAKAQVDAYYAKIAAGDFAAARAMWDQDGAASGGSAEDLKGAYAVYRSYTAQAETPTHIETREGIDYVIVTVAAKAETKSGATRELKGMVYLRRPAAPADAAKGQGGWKIWAVDVRPHH
ncbi:hypothetical protein [Sphingomonas azotifigens]|uniref:hypothetical protein n=1 Tax=Sphingomonas azotifigens TaxID=330920 RepID=UPI0009FBBF70|nr:hypothetical protein [Sphingomonas azotifigens]